MGAAGQDRWSRCKVANKREEAGLRGGEEDRAWEQGRKRWLLVGLGGGSKKNSQKNKSRKGVRAKVSSISQICPGSLQANLCFPAARLLIPFDGHLQHYYLHQGIQRQSRQVLCRLFSFYSISL